MSFVRPTLSEIVTRVQADFVSRLNLVGAVLRRSLVYVLSRVIAGASHMLHGHLDWLYRQLFPDTAEDAALVRQAAIFGMTKTAPTFAVGGASITGTPASEVPAGTILVRSDGAEYVTVLSYTGVTYEPSSATLDIDGEGILLFVALLAGADYTVEAGQVLSFQSPIAGVDSSATVIESAIDGTDEETTEALRTRFLERLAEPPMGGTSADYVAWAKTVPGVTRVWPSPLELGPGTVVVRFVRDNDGTGADIIPSVGEVGEVQAALDELAPVHATVTAHAPEDAPIAFTIGVTPNTTAVKDAVEAELTDLLLRVAEPGGTVLLSAIRTAIGTAPGLTDYTLTTPAADVTSTANQLRSVGTITWS